MASYTRSSTASPRVSMVITSFRQHESVNVDLDNGRARGKPTAKAAEANSPHRRASSEERLEREWNA